MLSKLPPTRTKFNGAYLLAFSKNLARSIRTIISSRRPSPQVDHVSKLSSLSYYLSFGISSDIELLYEPSEQAFQA